MNDVFADTSYYVALLGQRTYVPEYSKQFPNHSASELCLAIAATAWAPCPDYPSLISTAPLLASGWLP